jgi:RHS repeat-associated protein
LGRRIAIISQNGTITTENRYLWCGDSLCQSRTSADVVTRRYYPEGEVRPQGNTLLYYNRDHLGSVRDVLAVQNGSRVAAFDYDAYGKPTQTSGRLSTDFRYAGMFYLQEAGLYLTQYRVYDPNNGRWLSRDPIGENGGVNLYTYVGGNPLSWVDPLGLDYGFSVDPAAAGGNGHTTLYFQNGSGSWFAFNQGAVGETSSGGNFGFLTGSNAPASVSIEPITKPPSEALIYPTVEATDKKITSCAESSKKDHDSGTKKYNLYNNNCKDAAVNVLACAGINVPNPTFTISPNAWIKMLPQPPAWTKPLLQPPAGK